MFSASSQHIFYLKLLFLNTDLQWCSFLLFLKNKGYLKDNNNNNNNITNNKNGYHNMAPVVCKSKEVLITLH